MVKYMRLVAFVFIVESVTSASVEIHDRTIRKFTAKKLQKECNYNRNHHSFTLRCTENTMIFPRYLKKKTFLTRKKSA